jgi:hypothetical protein
MSNLDATFPDLPRGAARPPIRSLVEALRSAVADLGRPRHDGDDSAASVHRLVLALLDAGVAEGRPDLTRAAEQILASTLSELPVFAEAFVALLPSGAVSGTEQVVLVV